jgi:hypothetical protein
LGTAGSAADRPGNTAADKDNANKTTHMTGHLSRAIWDTSFLVSHCKCGKGIFQNYLEMPGNEQGKDGGKSGINAP